MHSYQPTYYEVYWYGPHQKEGLIKNLQEKEAIPADEIRNLVLYMICGTHSQYGKGVPLYIGKTERSIDARLNEHRDWIEHQTDPVQIYMAAISPGFTHWREIENLEFFAPPESEVISKIESLLIYAHQPTFNAKGKGGRPKVESDFVVFNTNRRSTLLPEISTMRWCT